MLGSVEGVVMCMHRLPIVQGSAICFLVPAIALFAQDECHSASAASHAHVTAAGGTVCLPD